MDIKTLKSLKTNTLADGLIERTTVQDPYFHEGGFDFSKSFEIEILCSFKLVLEGKTGKEIPESSRLEFLEKFLAILLYQMQKTTPPGC